MPNRKQYTETIIGSLRLAKHALAEQTLPAQTIRGRRKTQGTTAPITPAQWAILSLVMEKKEMSNKEVAHSLGITSGAVTQLVDGLVQKKYLTRENSADDRRRLSLKISVKHKQKLHDMKAKRLQQAATIFTSFTDDELAQYANLSKKFEDCILKLLSVIE